MSQPMMRGMVLVGFNEYFQRYCDLATRERVQQQLTPELQRLLKDIEGTTWYPREYFVELNRAIASLHGTEAGVCEGLTSVGRCLADVATGSFMKLLLKMLTPSLFARKFPTFWAHDMRGGRIDVDVSAVQDHKLDFWLRDVAGFDHVGPVARGYIQFAMSAITKTNVDVALGGWSLATPAPEEVHCAVTW